ncbi:MAG: hypothetical protein KBC12_00205 [Candidatus Pacebacteria bacterium]|nr:hypothetical protein [Candidatus Paceibacterota bacterium]MBP9851590.1 hypothetical protein [Candidatus Paceibacterota bacterium]
MKRLILSCFATALTFTVNPQTNYQGPADLDAQVIELFRTAQLAGDIIEHLKPDTIITEGVDTDTFYTSIIRRNRIVFLDVKSSAGLWRQELRVWNVIVFWYPKGYIGGLILQHRMRWDFYDLYGIKFKRPDLKLSTTDVSIQSAQKEIEAYIFRKK